MTGLRYTKATTFDRKFDAGMLAHPFTALHVAGLYASAADKGRASSVTTAACRLNIGDARVSGLLSPPP